MESLYKISITCFVASYLVVFVMEVSRGFLPGEFLRSKIVQFFRIGFAAAGLFAHTVYLACHGGLEFDSQGLWLGNWFGWCLAASWILAVAYLWISIRQQASVIGLFLLPIVNLLIWIGMQFGGSPSFSAKNARSGWNMLHGASLLLGTAIVALGCIFGIVYLWQSHRLKHKAAQSTWFRWPSLEWLQQSSERSLLVSALLLGIGLVSGIAINHFAPIIGPPGESATSWNLIEWSDPVVWSSGILFGWLLTATIFNLFYQPARQGRKVAYLMVASFLFLVLELVVVWWAGHATSSRSPAHDPSFKSPRGIGTMDLTVTLRAGSGSKNSTPQEGQPNA